jgi:hypothetical protein
MTVTEVAQLRGRELRRRLVRHRLVFVQLGSVFDPLRSGLIGELGGRQVTAVEFACVGAPEEGNHVLLDVEHFAGSSGSGPTMGMVREQIMQTLDGGFTTCLISRAPRISFPPVPGSSILDDAASHFIPLLQEDEYLEERRRDPAASLPAIGLDPSTELAALYERILSELGVELLAAMDHALFEAQMRGDDSLSLLEPRELEALRGAGIVNAAESGYSLTVPRRVGELTNALAEVLSKTTTPQAEIADVASDLWAIERILRSRVRRAAIPALGPSWRAQVLTGDLPDKILERARSEAYMGARSIKELRDPLEWLTLGELLELVERPPCDGLGLSSVEWRRFRQDILPVRNRMSHMRLLKRGDRETARQWASILRKRT